MTTLTIETVKHAPNERDCWGVFAPARGTDDGQLIVQRVHGPANLLDCCRVRSRLISAERHGEHPMRTLEQMRP